MADGTGLVPDVERIAILRANGPGDLVVSDPALSAVRAAYPDATEEEVDRWAAGQRAHRYDLARQMHGGGRFSNGLPGRLGARVTAGTTTPETPTRPGATDVRRCYPEERLGAVAQDLADRGARIGPSARWTSRRWSAPSPGPPR